LGNPEGDDPTDSTTGGQTSFVQESLSGREKRGEGLIASSF
jgi:hypothetical protein